MSTSKTLMFVLAMVLGAPQYASAQDASAGKEEFRVRCAVCHGATGLGDGPVGQMLKTPAPNLALLAEKNGGRFPFENVYKIVDGRADIAAHGTRDMPIWGDYYRGELLPMERADITEQLIRQRVLALVYYIGTLQTQK